MAKWIWFCVYFFGWILLPFACGFVAGLVGLTGNGVLAFYFVVALAVAVFALMKIDRSPFNAILLAIPFIGWFVLFGVCKQLAILTAEGYREES